MYIKRKDRRYEASGDILMHMYCKTAHAFEVDMKCQIFVILRINILSTLHGEQLATRRICHPCVYYYSVPNSV